VTFILVWYIKPIIKLLNKNLLSFLDLIYNFVFPVFGHQNSLDYLEHSPKVVIISYRMLSRLKKSMIDKNWALMIIDESHNIRCTKKKTEKDEVQTGFLFVACHGTKFTSHFFL
jgi:SNF2 family DNA or RNA helicase